MTWSGISSGDTAYRLKIAELEYASASPTILTGREISTEMILGFLNSPISHHCMKVINPTMQVNVGDALKLPFLYFDGIDRIQDIVLKLIEISKKDWDARETSLDFKINNLLNDEYKEQSLHTTYNNLCTELDSMVSSTRELEVQNNRIFIEAYHLQDELTSEVMLDEVTLTCNLYHRNYGSKNVEELEVLRKDNYIKEFISYAVGCMFGRYSLDKPGLILAIAGETVEDYLRQVPEPSFAPDEDNVIPVLEVNGSTTTLLNVLNSS